jgi:hypothetical protein
VAYDWKVALRKAAVAAALVVLGAVGAQLAQAQSLRPLLDGRFWDKQAALGLAAAIGAVIAWASNYASWVKAREVANGSPPV